MKRILVVLGVVAVMATAVAVAAGAALAQAQPERIHERLPVSGEMENPCNGEPIIVEGELRLVHQTTYAANGNILGIYHLSGPLRGVSPSGTQYVIMYSDHIRGHLLTNEGLYVQTNNGLTRVLRQGEDGTTADDFTGRFVFHITVNSDGEFVALVENFGGQCS